MKSLRQEPLGNGIVNSRFDHEELSQILDICDVKHLNKCSLRTLKYSLGVESSKPVRGAVKRGSRCHGTRLGVSLLDVVPFTSGRVTDG